MKLSPLLPGVAQGLAEVIEEMAGERVLFALHIFGRGTDGRGQYVSNAERADVIKALRELLDRWEKTGSDDGPLHEFMKKH